MSHTLREEYLICYDIADNKIRTKCHLELEKYGLQAMQKSVFWGYLTHAELHAIHRYFNMYCQENDKVLITHTRIDSRAHGYLIGHQQKEFHDWAECDVI